MIAPDFDRSTPRVSVLMPTFRQAAFIRRALESLRAQTYTDWELILINDGSPDETHNLVQPYLSDDRIRYTRLECNTGLGAALNLATRLARGRYLAYLPSDDVYYPEHLAQLVDLLDRRLDVYLAYGGVRWNYESYGPTLQGEDAVGREAEAAASGNILALVQVMHRRDLEAQVPWPTRAEIVSDRFEADHWRALLALGIQMAYSGVLSCEWVQHAEQRHRIVDCGLARYRAYFQIPPGVFLNFQPSGGFRVDERVRFGRFGQRRDLPAPDGLRILVVGDLGFNPERIVALEERGHKLYGLWLPHPETWDAAGPFSFGNIETIPTDRHWRDRVRALKPDAIYALLNWHAVWFIHEVLEAAPDIPMVFHFKEGPFLCQDRGSWPLLVEILRHSAGRVFISPENRRWFELALDAEFDPDTTLIIDGDLPKIEHFTDEWRPKLSAQDGEIHTVCTGRPLGMVPFSEIAAAGIHVHFYGVTFHEAFPNFTRDALATGYMHLHSTVEPHEWVRELSQYDAAWFHVFDSFNRGDLRRAHWDDLNLPARLGTYAAAGLPWILKDNRHSTVAMQSLALQYDVGVFYNSFAELGDRLRERSRIAQQTANMRAARCQFAFDTHADSLVALFRRVGNRG